MIFLPLRQWLVTRSVEGMHSPTRQDVNERRGTKKRKKEANRKMVA